LEEVLRHLSDELSAWRRRALSAESRVADQSAPMDKTERAHRLRELEEEKRTLEQRLDAARVRLSELVGRLDFLEQQAHNTEARSETAK
jgi:hypothetical protein